VEVRLSEVEGGTRVDYDAEAVIGGMIGGVGQRMLSSVAKKTAKDFFAAIESHLVLNETAVPVQAAPLPAVTAPAVPVLDGAAAGGPSVTAPASPGVPGTAGHTGTAQVFERPAKQPRPGVPAWSLLAGFGMGAGVALGSAVIGWLLGRSGRKR
jgi:hypothetical protein